MGGSQPRDPIPAQANQCPFSSFGNIDNIPVVAASRRTILAIADAVVLGLGLLLLHVRSTRHRQRHWRLRYLERPL